MCLLVDCRFIRLVLELCVYDEHVHNSDGDVLPEPTRRANCRGV